MAHAPMFVETEHSQSEGSDYPEEAPFQVHSRVFGWKLTSMKRRQQLLRMRYGSDGGALDSYREQFEKEAFRPRTSQLRQSVQRRQRAAQSGALHRMASKRTALARAVEMPVELLRPNRGSDGVVRPRTAVFAEEREALERRAAERRRPIAEAEALEKAEREADVQKQLKWLRDSNTAMMEDVARLENELDAQFQPMTSVSLSSLGSTEPYVLKVFQNAQKRTDILDGRFSPVAEPAPSQAVSPLPLSPGF